MKSNPTGNATSVAVTTLFTTVNAVVNVPVTFVTPFFGVIVNVPFPGAALFVVSYSTSLVGITSAYLYVFPVALSVNVTSFVGSTATFAFLVATLTVYFSLNLLKSNAVTV